MKNAHYINYLSLFSYFVESSDFNILSQNNEIINSMKFCISYPSFSMNSDRRTGMTKSKSLFTKLRFRVKSEKPRRDFYVIKISSAKLLEERRA